MGETPKRDLSHVPPKRRHKATPHPNKDRSTLGTPAVYRLNTAQETPKSRDIQNLGFDTPDSLLDALFRGHVTPNPAHDDTLDFNKSWHEVLPA